MKKAIMFGIFSLLLLSLVGFVSAQNPAGCKNLYWFDNTNKSCSQKEFCGTYMYLGLETFSSKEQCERALNSSNSENNKSITKFIPWQKRNESECPLNCSCQGAVVSCKTDDGKIMTITAGNSGNVITIVVNKTEANTTLEIERESNNKTKIKALLSNGRKAEIKIMPDSASEKAIERLGKLNFTIQLKEVGKNNETRAAYEVTGEKQGKFLGLFKIIAKESTQIDAETGNIISVKKPWWAFLASGI